MGLYDNLIIKGTKIQNVSIDIEDLQEEGRIQEYNISDKNILVISIPDEIINYSQNITNTLPTGGSFMVKDGSATFLSLNQGNGFLSLNKNFILSHSADSLHGVIYKGTNSFLHDYQAAGTDGSNIFLGNNSGNFTMSGTGILASYNIGIGT